MPVLFSTFHPSQEPTLAKSNDEIVFFFGKIESCSYKIRDNIRKIYYDDLLIQKFIDQNFKKIPQDKGFKFRIDKFIYKIATIREALHQYGQFNDLVWLDSDIQIYAKLNEYLDYISPKNKECFSYYDRIGVFPYAETGVIFFSKIQWQKNSAFYDFLYTHVISGNVFHDEEWHDAFLISKYAKILSINTKNLCKDNRLLTSNPIFEHKIARNCLIHKKGGRKKYPIFFIYTSDFVRMIFGKIVYRIKFRKYSL